MVKLILKNESDIIFLPRNKGKLKWKDFHQWVTPIVYEIKKKNQVLKGWEKSVQKLSYFNILFQRT